METYVQPYIYFIGVTLLLPIFIYLFLQRKNRRTMLFVGICFGIVGIIDQQLLAQYDYWNPVYIFPKFPFEDYYYGFVLGGIFSTICKSKFKFNINRLPIAVIMAIFSILFFVLGYLIKVNYIIPGIIPLIFMGIVSLIIDKKMLKILLLTGLTSLLLNFVMYQILLLLDKDIFIKYWFLEKLSGIFILNLPIEEYLFAFAIGVGAVSLAFMMGLERK